MHIFYIEIHTHTHVRLPALALTCPLPDIFLCNVNPGLKTSRLFNFGGTNCDIFTLIKFLLLLSYFIIISIYYWYIIAFILWVPPTCTMVVPHGHMVTWNSATTRASPRLIRQSALAAAIHPLCQWAVACFGENRCFSHGIMYLYLYTFNMAASKVIIG